MRTAVEVAVSSEFVEVGARMPVLRLRDPEWLRVEYEERGRTQQDIARQLGCHQSNVQRWLRRHGIATRPVGPRPRSPRTSIVDETFSELAQIVDEMVSGLECDRKNHSPSYELIAQRVRTVSEASMQHDEPWMKRCVLIELARAALLRAEAETPTRRVA